MASADSSCPIVWNEIQQRNNFKGRQATFLYLHTLQRWFVLYNNVRTLFQCMIYLRQSFHCLRDRGSSYQCITSKAQPIALFLNYYDHSKILATFSPLLHCIVTIKFHFLCLYLINQLRHDRLPNVQQILELLHQL